MAAISVPGWTYDSAAADAYCATGPGAACEVQAGEVDQATCFDLPSPTILRLAFPYNNIYSLTLLLVGCISRTVCDD